MSLLDEVDSAQQRPSDVFGVVLPGRDDDLEALAEPRKGLPLDPLLVLLFNLAMIFIGGALIAPPLYWAMQALAGTFPGLAGEPFRRYVSRCLLLVAFLRLRPLVRGLGVRSARDIGWVSLHGNWRRLPQGLSVGLVSFAVVAIVAVGAGGRLVNPDVSMESFAGRLPSILSTMTAVAVLEETLFRGAIFGMLQQSWNWLAALALSSLLYASVHFIPTVANAGPVTIGSGLAVVAGMFKGFSEPQALMPEFLNLTLIGALLAWGYRRTGNLHFSIGLHAGWIFLVKTYGVITLAAGEEHSSWWGTRKLVDGWIVLLGVVVATLLIPVVLRNPSRVGPAVDHGVP